MKKFNLMILTWFVGITIFACIMSSCKSTYQPCDAYGSNDVKWENSIDNPENGEFVCEVAFNEGCTAEQVTQEQFDSRYSAGY